MFGGKIGLPEIAIVVFIALLIFGPKKLGELGKGLGEGIKNFKSSMSEGSSTTTSSTEETSSQAISSANLASTKLR